MFSFTVTHTNLIGLHVFFQISSAEASVPVISDVSSIHDFPKQIPQVLPWHLCHHNYKNHCQGNHNPNSPVAPSLAAPLTTSYISVSVIQLYTMLPIHNNNKTHLCISLQVIVKDINWYSQISSAEWILSVPTLGPKLPPLRHTGVKVTERKQDGLKLLLTAALIQDVLERGQSNKWIDK